MIISRTPLRASFFGGGSDLGDYYRNSASGYGAALSTAIDMYIYITVNKKFDDQIRISYSKTEIVDCVDQIEHNIIREALKIAGVEKGIEIVYMGDIPLGSAGVGLASSSALAVGVLNALFAYQGQAVSAEFLAQKACEIEIDRLKNPIGKQDQYATAYGGFHHYRFNADESVFVNPLICRPQVKQALQENLMFFYTNMTHISSHILKEQREHIPQKMETLDRMVGMSYDAERLLQKNALNEFGALLDEAWKLKKQLASGISDPRIDEMYAAARKAGALGGKILGAGGGGFMMLYVPENRRQSVREALSQYREQKVALDPEGSKIIYVR